MGSIFIPPPIGSTVLTGGLSSLGNPFGFAFSQVPVQPPALPAWWFVRRRFGLLLDELKITQAQREDGETKRAGVTACLNRAYYGHSSDTANGILIGSWGKWTRVRPPPDVDLLFLLPNDVYWRFERRAGNRQSQLLQEVKGVLAATYPRTDLRGDGQVVVVPFDSTAVEIAPGFRCQDGSIIACDSNGGGRYPASSAEAEIAALADSDARWNGNTRALVRMTKAWKREKNVPLKSFWIERLAIEFLAAWRYSQEDVFYYDWMVRDFLAHMIARANGCLVMPGIGEVIWLGDDWLSRAVTAHCHAVIACEREMANHETSAGAEWQEIFGDVAPLLVS
jgi:hypothetical protein